MLERYATVRDMAEKWKLKPRTIQIMCAQGKINGVAKFGRNWAIPIDAKRPKDNRVVSGNYKVYKEDKESL